MVLSVVPRRLFLFRTISCLKTYINKCSRMFGEHNQPDGGLLSSELSCVCLECQQGVWVQGSRLQKGKQKGQQKHQRTSTAIGGHPTDDQVLHINSLCVPFIRCFTSRRIRQKFHHITEASS